MPAGARSHMSRERLKNVMFMKTKLSDRFFPTMKSDCYDRMRAGARPYMSRDESKIKWRRTFKTGAERVLKIYFRAAHIKLALDQNSGF